MNVLLDHDAMAAMPPFKTRSEGKVYREEFVEGAERLYLFFAGAFGAFGVLPEDYVRTARIEAHSRIFMCDPYQAWYQRGVPLLGDTPQAVAQFLGARIAASGAREVRFVGNCMGGFAAILFCSLLDTGRAVAFAPQTYLSPERGEHNTDPRGKARLRELYRHRAAHCIYDLRPWLLQHTPQLRVDIHICAHFVHDLPHAEELADLENVRIHRHEQGGHRVQLHLLHSGLMPAILAA